MLASQFFAYIKMTEVMIEEFKEEHPQQFENDVNTKMAFQEGFKGFKSNSVDYFLEHHNLFPLTLVLFYDSGLLDSDLMRSLS